MNTLPSSIRPQLGLVCITTSDQIRFRTITRTRLLQLTEAERLPVLSAIYQDNLNRVLKAIDFCAERGIGMYRLSSNLMPFADDPAHESVLLDCAALMRQIGERAAQRAIRLLTHPEQFVVLSSDSPARRGKQHPYPAHACPHSGHAGTAALVCLPDGTARRQIRPFRTRLCG